LPDDKPPRRVVEHLIENDAHRSLQRIAARLLAIKELEEVALVEIDKIPAAIDDEVRWKFRAGAGLFVLFSLLTVAAFMAWFAISITGPDQGYRPLIVVAPMAAIAIGPLAYWRHLQYGFGPVRTTRSPIYCGGSKATIETIEKLFAYLALRTSPRAYYCDRDGKKCYVSRRYFCGALRGLLLSEDAAVRTMALPPGGLWFFREIRIEAEPEDIIAALKMKPRSGGRPRQYDHAAIILSVLEHPKMRSIEPERHGSIAETMALIHSLCDPSDEHDNDIPVPEDTELRDLAKRILAAVEKNRSQPKK
jgi:hypothetical protein